MGENTEQHIRDFFEYDPITGIITARVSFGPHKANSRVGGRKRNGYRVVGAFWKVYPEHHLAWFLYHGRWPTEAIDHINGVRDDNRIENLREVTHAENCKNRRRMKNNSSGVQGVYYSERHKMWKANIQANGHAVFLGYYRTIDEATIARKAAERALGYHKNHGSTIDAPFQQAS